MLFRVDEMNFVSGKRNYVEFKMYSECTRWDEKLQRNVEYKGFAFRCYSGNDIRWFLTLWLESIQRACEISSFRYAGDVAKRYTDYVKRHGSDFAITFPVDDISHGKIYRYV